MIYGPLKYDLLYISVTVPAAAMGKTTKTKISQGTVINLHASPKKIPSQREHFGHSNES